VLAGTAGAGALDIGAAVLGGAGALDVGAAVLGGAVLGGTALVVVATGEPAIWPAMFIDADVAGLLCVFAVGFEQPLAAPMMMIRLATAPRNDKNLCLRMNSMW
jgi:hypothetical protein